MRLCSTYKFFSPVFLHISIVWSMLDHKPVGRFQVKECHFTFTDAFRHLLLLLLLLFFVKKCVFIVFISFFDEVSNFRYKILTNKKTDKLSAELSVQKK